MPHPFYQITELALKLNLRAQLLAPYPSAQVSRGNNLRPQGFITHSTHPLDCPGYQYQVQVLVPYPPPQLSQLINLREPVFVPVKAP